MAKSIFVADDEATAKRYGPSAEGAVPVLLQAARPQAGRRSAARNLFKLDQSEPDATITPDTITRKLVIAGTVNSVVEQILAFREKVGDFGTLSTPATTGWIPRSANARCS